MHKQRQSQGSLVRPRASSPIPCKRSAARDAAPTAIKSVTAIAPNSAPSSPSSSQIGASQPGPGSGSGSGSGSGLSPRSARGARAARAADGDQRSRPAVSGVCDSSAHELRILCCAARQPVSSGGLPVPRSVVEETSSSIVSSVVASPLGAGLVSRRDEDAWIAAAAFSAETMTNGALSPRASAASPPITGPNEMPHNSAAWLAPSTLAGSFGATSATDLHAPKQHEAPAPATRRAARNELTSTAKPEAACRVLIVRPATRTGFRPTRFTAAHRQVQSGAPHQSRESEPHVSGGTAQLCRAWVRPA